MTEGAQAWVTLATNDSYALGALVLARSLRRVNTSRQLAVMITPGVSSPMRDILSEVFDVVSEVNILDSEDAANLALLSRPELGITFTKIHCWKLTQFSKCVFLDADTLIIQNSDELFDREELSAAPDAGWPDCFNSGVFVFKPAIDTYTSILNFALSHGSFDGGDQGLLNMYFSGWSQADASRRLPFIYNMCASATYSYLPAYRVFGQTVKIVHFIGQEKPWLIFFDTATGAVRPPSGQEHLQELLQSWWNIFRSDVHPRLSPEMGGGDNQSATMVEQVQASFSQIFISAEQPASQFSFYQPPPQPSVVDPHPDPHPNSSSHFEHQENPPNTEQPPPPPPVPQFLVAIQRYPPEHFWTPPPPPPVMHHPPPHPHSSPESSDSENNLQTPPPHPPHNNNHSSSGGGSSLGSPQGNNSGNPSNDSQNEHPNQSSQHSNPENAKKKKRSKSKGIAGVYAKIAMQGEKSGEQLEYEDHMRKQAWEFGHIDYMGKDSFDNIMKRIQTSMAQTSVQRPKAKSPTPHRRSPPKQEATAPAPQPSPSTTVTPPSPSESTSTPSPQETPVVEPKVEATPAPTTTATPVPKPKVETSPAPTTPTIPVSEPIVKATTAKTQSAAPTPVVTEQASSGPEPDLTREEERKALEERQALERKLAEQKKAAEQKLEEEKLAAAARAAAAAAAAAASSVPPLAPKVEPKAPPRKETGLGNAMQYGVGLGLLGAAVVLVFAIYTAYSPASLFL